MKKKTAKRAATKTASVARRSTAKPSIAERFFSVRHLPLHGALLGAALVLVKGFVAVLGLALVLVGIFVYITRAVKSGKD